MKKCRYFINRSGKLVKLISDVLLPFELYIALVEPEKPNIGNLYYVKSNGNCQYVPINVTKLGPCRQTDFDLVEDITCCRCDGRGVASTWLGIDHYERRNCYDCKGSGYKLAKKH